MRGVVSHKELCSPSKRSFKPSPHLVSRRWSEAPSELRRRGNVCPGLRWPAGICYWYKSLETISACVYLLCLKIWLITWRLFQTEVSLSFGSARRHSPPQSSPAWPDQEPEWQMDLVLLWGRLIGRRKNNEHCLINGYGELVQSHIGFKWIMHEPGWQLAIHHERERERITAQRTFDRVFCSGLICTDSSLIVHPSGEEGLFVCLFWSCKSPPVTTNKSPEESAGDELQSIDRLCFVSMTSFLLM